MAKFYAKMRVGKGSAIGMLAELLAVVCCVNSCYVSKHTIIIFIAADWASSCCNTTTTLSNMNNIETMQHVVY